MRPLIYLDIELRFALKNFDSVRPGYIFFFFVERSPDAPNSINPRRRQIDNLYPLYLCIFTKPTKWNCGEPSLFFYMAYITYSRLGPPENPSPDTKPVGRRSIFDNRMWYIWFLFGAFGRAQVSNPIDRF